MCSRSEKLQPSQAETNLSRISDGMAFSTFKAPMLFESALLMAAALEYSPHISVSPYCAPLRLIQYGRMWEEVAFRERMYSAASRLFGVFKTSAAKADAGPFNDAS